MEIPGGGQAAKGDLLRTAQKPMPADVIEVAAERVVGLGAGHTRKLCGGRLPRIGDIADLQRVTGELRARSDAELREDTA
jgi:hypothetical protein